MFIGINNKDCLAENLLYLREINGMTGVELGKKLDCSKQAISKWECGEGYPKVDMLKKLSEFYGLSIDTLKNEPIYLIKSIKISTIDIENILDFDSILDSYYEKLEEESEYDISLKRAFEKFYESFEVRDYRTFKYLINEAIELTKQSYKQTKKIDRVVLIVFWIIFLISSIKSQLYIEGKQGFNLEEAFADESEFDVIQKSFNVRCSIYKINKYKDDINKAILGWKQHYTGILLNCINILKHNKSTNELAEILLCFSYISNIIANDFSEEFNYLYGIEMLNNLSIFGNKYAILADKVLNELFGS